MTRFLSRTALGLTVVLALTACQGDGSEKSDKKDGPSRVPASKMDAVTLPDDPAKLADVVTDRMDQAGTVHVEISLAPDKKETESLEDTGMDLILSDPPKAKMTVVDSASEQPSTSHIVVENEVIYTTIEGQEMEKGKPWMRISQEEVDNAEEQLGPFAEIFNVILRETNESLDQATGDSSLDIVRLGKLDGDPSTEEGDGGTVTRYEGTTSTYDVADAGHEDFKELADQGLEEVTWELAVTDKGLPSEFTVEMLTPDGEQPATSTVRYSKWGSEMTIERPAKEKTSTLTGE